MSHESYGARDSARARANICQFMDCIMRHETCIQCISVMKHMDESRTMFMRRETDA